MRRGVPLGAAAAVSVRGVRAPILEHRLQCPRLVSAPDPWRCVAPVPVGKQGHSLIFELMGHAPLPTAAGGSGDCPLMVSLRDEQCEAYATQGEGDPRSGRRTHCRAGGPAQDGACHAAPGGPHLGRSGLLVRFRPPGLFAQRGGDCQVGAPLRGTKALFREVWSPFSERSLAWSRNSTIGFAVAVRGGARHGRLMSPSRLPGRVVGHRGRRSSGHRLLLGRSRWSGLGAPPATRPTPRRTVPRPPRRGAPPVDLGSIVYRTPTTAGSLLPRRAENRGGTPQW